MALCAIVVTALVCDRVSSATGDKQLARVKGIVGYQDTPTSAFRPIFGRLDLPDDAYAVTKQNGSAILRLADSSEIDIGEKTIVQVGAFNAASSGNQNTIALNNGALHFVIRHPTGGQSNYKFVTATSQIAVRGTEGFLVAGLQGTQVVCVQCAAGDVTVQVGQQTISVLSNQTLTVLGSNPLTATSSLTSSTTVNNPAVNQFNNGSNPISGASGGNGFDPTSSFSGTGAGAGGGIGGGTIAGVAGGAAGAAAVAGATSTKSSSSSPSPTPAPVITPSPQPGPLVVSVSFPGASAVFPVPFSWPFSQTNATTQATVSCTPPSVATCAATQTLANGSLNGTVNGNLIGPGQFTFTGSASGVVPVTATFSVYGALTSNIPTINFTGLGSQSVTITQLPTGTALSATVSCNSGAALSLASSSGLSPWTLTMQATAAPNTTPPPSVACTVTVTGQGGTSASTITIPVNITSTSIGVSTHVRKPL